jgi:peptidyl-prolyl cis-trans isomerase D
MASITPNKLDLKAAYDESKLSVDFDYVLQPYSSVPDEEVSVSDNEIAKLYKERKNTFKREEGRLVDYIAVNILPSGEDYQRIAEKMDVVKDKLTGTAVVANLVTENSEVPYMDAFVSYKQLSDDLKRFVDNSGIGAIEGPVLNNNVYSIYKYEAETVAPDSIRLNILGFPMGMDETAIKHLSDSLINVVKTGTSFADMVKQAAGDETGGDRGWQTETSFLQQVQGDVACKNEVFSAPVKEPRLIQSAYGNFIVQVVEKTAPVKKYKIATIQTTVTPSQATKTKLYNDLNQYISRNHSLTAFKDSAAAAGYLVQKEVEIAKNQLNISNIQSTRQVVQWAFKNKKGAVSTIFECQNQEYFVIAAVEEVLKEGFKSEKSVADLLKRELLDDKKAEKIINDLTAKKLTSLEQYAEALNTSPRSVKFVTFATPSISGGVGAEPILNAKAPLAAVGELSGPYKGKKGVYVIQVTDKRESETPYDEATQRQTMQMQSSYRMYQLFQTGSFLKDNADVEDHFDRFY